MNPGLPQETTTTAPHFARRFCAFVALLVLCGLLALSTHRIEHQLGLADGGPSHACAACAPVLDGPADGLLATTPVFSFQRIEPLLARATLRRDLTRQLGFHAHAPPALIGA